MATALVALANITLASPQATVTFSSIPSSGYRDLRLIMSATQTTASRYTSFQVNGDTGSNYSAVQMFGNGSTGTPAAYSNGGQFVAINNMFESTTEATMMTLDIFDYSLTDKQKMFTWQSGLAGTAINASAGRWANTSAITSLALISTSGGSNTFAAGSSFALYGIAG